MNPNNTSGTTLTTERRLHTKSADKTTAKISQPLIEGPTPSATITADTATSPNKANGFNRLQFPSQAARAAQLNEKFSPRFISQKLKRISLLGSFFCNRFKQTA
ncbi:MAG: hypothetical protein NTV80_06605 [Verrucomicrobia bacterium]|nr:hypothetical protein [Verrucomicrobiota bacterium]